MQESNRWVNDFAISYIQLYLTLALFINNSIAQIHEMKHLSSIEKDKLQLYSSQQQDNQQHQSQSLKNNPLSDPSNMQEYFAQLYSHPVYSELSTSQLHKLNESFPALENPFENYFTPLKMPPNIQENLSIDQIISQIKRYKIIDRNFLQQKVLASKIFTKCPHSTNQLVILQIIPSKYYEVVTLEIQLSCFKTKVQIFNSKADSHVHDQGYLGGFGAFGNVYFIKSLHELYAVKCILFHKNSAQYNVCISQRERIFIATLKEYFFLLLFSVLEIGPKVKKIMGFDLIVSEDCIQFSTQLCENQQISFEDVISIKNCLRTMHALDIVHRDIKPDNIMYSKTFKRHVLIDFGGCSVLKESIGHKNVSMFLGTTGFCTEEMFQLLSSNKGYVDLYFNDLYGLKRTIQKYQEYKRNIFNQSIFYEEKQKAHFRIESLTKPFILLNLIKYLAYNHFHNDLVYHWKILEKRHSSQLEQVIIEFLKFLIDVNPDKKLMNFYYKFISETVRVNDEFNELCRVFENSFIDPLTYWREIPWKMQLFYNQTFFYDSICIIHGNYTKTQKNVLKIMMNKQSIETFLFSNSQNNTRVVEKRLRESLKNSISEQKGEQKGQFEKILYFLVVVNYCTFTQNKYNANFTDKIKAAELAISLIQKQDDEKHLIKTTNQTFYCHILEFKPLTKLFSYFMLKIWVSVPAIFQDQSMKNCVSSLYLLGYPTYIDTAKLLIQYQITKSFLSRNSKIINIWIFNVILINFGDVLYDRKKDSQFFCQEQVPSIRQSYKELMKQQNDSPQSFYALNQHFFTEIYQNSNAINEQKIRIAVKLLQKDYDFEQISKQDFQQWKQLMYFILKYLADVFHILFEGFNLTWVKEFNVNILKNTKSNLPYLFCLPYSKIYIWSSSKKMGEIIQIADQIIGFQKISFRYLPYCRLTTYHTNKDYKNLKKVVQVVYENVLSGTILNLGSLNTTINQIKELIFQEAKQVQIKFSNLSNEQELFKDIIEETLSLSVFYSNFQDKNNPLKQLMEDTNKYNMSNIISNINNLHNVLYNLKEIFTIYLKVKRKKQENVYILANYQLIDSNYESDYKTQLQTVEKCLDMAFTNIDLKPYLKNSRNSKNQYVSFMMNLSIKRRQFQKAQSAFQDNFGHVTFNQIHNNSLQTPPLMRTYAIYCILKMRNSSDIFWDMQLLEVYKICLKQNSLINPLKDALIYRVFLQALIYCQRDYKQIEEFIFFLTDCIKHAPTKINAQKVEQILQSKFRCTCKNCFSRNILNWNPLAFAKYMEQRILTYDQKTVSYMALVFANFFDFKEAPIKLKLRCFDFIRKCHKYLFHSIRLIVTEKLDAYAFNYFVQLTGLNVYFDRIKYQVKESLNMLRQIQVPVLQEIRQKFNPKVIRKYIQILVRKMRRSKIKGVSQTYLNEIFYREKLIKGWFLPPIVKSLISKKISRYYAVKKNFRIYFDPDKLKKSVIHI